MSDKPTVRSFGNKTQQTTSGISKPLPDVSAAPPIPRAAPTSAASSWRRSSKGAQPPKMNTQAAALRFFLTITLGRADLAPQLARPHYPRKLPRVLAPEQVTRLIEAAPGPGLKDKTAFSIGHAHHRGIQARRACATQAGRDARRRQDRHLVSPGNLVRRLGPSSETLNKL
jgi:integrase/recombinase XerD